jgi:hypothetical protein
MPLGASSILYIYVFKVFCNLVFTHTKRGTTFYLYGNLKTL